MCTQFFEQFSSHLLFLQIFSTLDKILYNDYTPSIIVRYHGYIPYRKPYLPVRRFTISIWTKTMEECRFGLWSSSDTGKQCLYTEV